LTTAKRRASTCEKRLRYWLISFALPMLESRRTMVWRVWTSAFMAMAGGFRKCARCASGRGRAVDDPRHGRGMDCQLVERDPFVGGMRLGDVAGAVDDGVEPGGGEQGGFGPEVDGVADRQAQAFGEVARGEAAFFCRGGVPGGMRGTV